MAGTILLTPSGGPVATELAPVVSVKPTWGDGWRLVDHAIFDRLSVVAGSEGVSRLGFTVPYGTLKSLFETSFGARAAAGFAGWWARLDFVDPAGGRDLAFLGRIHGETRSVYGASTDVAGSSAARPKGLQRFDAYGGGLALRLRSISTAFFEVDGDAVEVGWTPGFNQRDSRGFLVGNRSAATVGGTYVFGGTAAWTRRQAIDYVLARFLDDAGGPTWTLGGQVDAVDQPLEDLSLGVASTVEEVLRGLIPRQAGLDFVVVPTLSGGEPTGFEIRVFALVGTNVSFRGATLPRNPNVVTLDVTRAIDVASVDVTRDETHTASRVRLVGARVLVCGTLRGPTLAGDPTGDVLTSTAASLRGDWTTAEETAYKAGHATADTAADEEQHDLARAADRFRPVYQRFTAPRDWVPPVGFRPRFDGSGEVASGEAAPYQLSARATLSWLPLREGVDYAAGAAVDANPAGTEADFRAPLVLAENRAAEIEADDGRTILAPVDKLGISVSVLKTDLGVQLGATPNHRLARGRWSPAAPGTSPSDFDPSDDGEGLAHDPRSLAATLAWRSDERWFLEASIAEADDDGSVLELELPEAELWWLAPDTIVDVRDGVPVTSGPVGRVLRNDADRFAGFMAGVVARYLFGRARAEVTFRCWKPWGSLVGSILLAVEEGGESHGINGPITSVELVGGMSGEPRTTVRAGFA